MCIYIWYSGCCQCGNFSRSCGCNNNQCNYDCNSDNCVNNNNRHCWRRVCLFDVFERNRCCCKNTRGF